MSYKECYCWIILMNIIEPIGILLTKFIIQREHDIWNPFKDNADLNISHLGAILLTILRTKSNIVWKYLLIQGTLCYSGSM